jgi:hypothetical protein
MTAFDRIDTPAEYEAARRELARLAYEEGRPSRDPQRAALADAIREYERRQQEHAP